MAEGESANNNSWESWLGGWVQTAKEKSSSALEMVKKDLAEFTCTMQKDTEKAVEMTKESINKENTTQATNKVKAGLSSFLDSISKVLVIPPDDNYIPVKVAPDGSGLYDRGKARLHAIQLDASTYMDPPAGPPEQYSMWQESFNLDEHKGEISELLVSKVEVRALYTRLVPSEVSHAEFWQRYFYRVHQLHCDEARKQALMKRADQTKGDSFSWDDDDDNWSEGEDENNHSDWEKLPRPSQSQVAPPSMTAQQPEEQQQNPSLRPSEETPRPTCSTENAEISLEKHPSSNKTNDCETFETGSRFKEQKEEHGATKNVSVFTASSGQCQAEVADTETSEPRLKDSEDVQDAAGDFLSHPELLSPSADLWSLHVPSDTASAGQDIEFMESAALGPGFPSDASGQVKESERVSGGSSSFAAGGSGVSSASDEKYEIPTNGGACGAADVGPVHINTCQASEPSSDVFAASVDISGEPHLPQIPGRGVSFVDVHPRLESAQVTEHSSETATKLADRNVAQSVATPASACQTSASVKEVSHIETEIAAEVCVSEAVAVASADAHIPQETSGRSEIRAESTEASPQNSSLVPEISEAESPSKAGEGEEIKEIGMRLKGDMVVVGDRDSPLSTESNDTKELGLEDDWEQDFEIEVTEEDLKAAESIAKRLGENLNTGDDDWENWE